MTGTIYNCVSYTLIIRFCWHILVGVGAIKEFRQERKEYLHKKNEMIKKKGSGREEQVNFPKPVGCNA